MQQLNGATPIQAPAGRHVVQLSRLDSGAYRVETLLNGPVAVQVPELTRSFPDRDLARHIATVIWGTLRKDGATVADAQRAVAAYFDGLIKRLADSPSHEVAELVAEIQDYRAGFADNQPIGLAALKTLAAPRQVRGTIAGAHLTDITDPQRQAIDVAAALGGTVLRSKAHPLPVLRALARKGFGTLNFDPAYARRRVVESLTLNSRGWALARTAVTS